MSEVDNGVSGTRRGAQLTDCSQFWRLYVLADFDIAMATHFLSVSLSRKSSVHTLTDWQRRVYIRDVIGHPPYGHGAREIGGSHE